MSRSASQRAWSTKQHKEKDKKKLFKVFCVFDYEKVCTLCPCLFSLNEIAPTPSMLLGVRGDDGPSNDPCVRKRDALRSKVGLRDANGLRSRPCGTRAVVNEWQQL